VATTKKSSTEDKKPKRRLRSSTETMRERQQGVATVTERKQSRAARVVRPLGWPLRKVGGLSVWRAAWFKPFRFVGKWIGLIFWPPYFRSSFGELKLVTWPDWRKSWRLTFAVLAFAAVFGVAIAGVDFGLDKLFKEVLLK
jgi:preprotein translocase SecE subunit